MTTHEWWTKQRASFDGYTSDFVVEEASRGDAVAAAERVQALADLPRLTVTPAVAPLAQRLVTALSLPQRARLDATHVAVCAVNKVQFLLTWNCTNLANAVLADTIEQTCRDAGFIPPRIVTPLMLMEPP